MTNLLKYILETMVDTAEKKCKRPGCNKMYTEANNDGTYCNFHSGQPIFHDLKKGWMCCNQVCYEWAEFEKMKGCCMGKHSDDKDAAKDSQIYSAHPTSVAAPTREIKKQEITTMKTAEDFNKE